VFSDSRYVVIDDDPKQLRILVDVLHELGAPCRGIHYDSEKGLNGKSLSGVRILFLDLHLNGSRISGTKADYSVIAGMLEEHIQPTSGPYIIILWTSHLEERTKFTEYIEEAITAERRPLAVLGLDKNVYLVPGETAGANLKNDVEIAVASDPKILALLTWEQDVLSAAGATLAELGSLIPAADRTPNRYSESLDGILSALAIAAVGAKNAANDPRAAVNAALAPILADRIVNTKSTASNTGVWQSAVTKIDNPPAFEPQQVAKMNAMLHIVTPAFEAIRSTDWGAVIELPGADADEFCRTRFGLTVGELLSGVFQIADKKGRRECRLILVRIGASCDYAQGKVGPVPYVLGVLRPLTAERADRSRPLGEHISPWLELQGEDISFDLVTNARFVITARTDEFLEAKVLFRIREQLLMQISNSTANHSIRPGLLEFRPSLQIVPKAAVAEESKKPTGPDLAMAPA
jgi:hypothetical protein